MDSIWSTECRKVLITEGKLAIVLWHKDGGVGKPGRVHFDSKVRPPLW